MSFLKYLRVKPGECAIDSKIVGASWEPYLTAMQYSHQEEGNLIYKKIGEFKKKPAVETPVPFAVGQVVKNKKGETVRILCVDRIVHGLPPVYVIVGLELCGGTENTRTYQMNGQYSGQPSEYDLVPPTLLSEEVIELVLDDPS